MIGTNLTFENYRAKLVRLDKFEAHPNADRLKIAIVDYQRVIVGLNVQVGELYVYFPLESQINLDLLSFINGFYDGKKNLDPTKKGFFGDKGRVKATPFRGVLSEGYLLPLKELNNFLQMKKMNILTERDLGVEFDSIDGVVFCQKYVVGVAKGTSDGTLKEKKKKGDPRKSFNPLIENQFRFHEKTAQLKRSLREVTPDSLISVSYKLHGTSAIFGRVLCKKQLNWYERLLKKAGVGIVETEYKDLYSSRTVIKNHKNQNDGFYKEDAWAIVFKDIKDKLKDGISIYGEIVGFLPSGKCIQKNFDYGVEKGKCKFYVYRITYTNPAGDVFEFSRAQLDDYCKKYLLNTVPLFYYGKAEKMFNIPVDENWHENFLNKLIGQFTEKDCFMCANVVPEEGIVIVTEGLVWNGLKLKSDRFYTMETQNLDAGEVDIEG